MMYKWLLVTILTLSCFPALAETYQLGESEVAVRNNGDTSYQTQALENILSKANSSLSEMKQVNAYRKGNKTQEDKNGYFIVPKTYLKKNNLLNETVRLANKECVAELPTGITSVDDIKSITELDLPEYTFDEFKSVIAMAIQTDNIKANVIDIENPNVHNVLFSSYYGIGIAKVKLEDKTTYAFFSQKSDCLKVASIFYLNEVDASLLPQ